MLLESSSICIFNFIIVFLTTTTISILCISRWTKPPKRSKREQAPPTNPDDSSMKMAVTREAALKNDLHEELLGILTDEAD
ncbi:hypothetical protein B9Z55_008452 [Caenorhabditis nigoni]|uniref:Uncharacterized protein n=1 Tax=Caenorhabditis nigoni TaxID=1611254 RepID=A0A2G5UMU8_9PELO|nr:hypothetical protein B9Z55_008452 [Caenorhabditis nigoni]